jgi:hypothetical protein
MPHPILRIFETSLIEAIVQNIVIIAANCLEEDFLSSKKGIFICLMQPHLLQCNLGTLTTKYVSSLKPKGIVLMDLST